MPLQVPTPKPTTNQDVFKLADADSAGKFVAEYKVTSGSTKYVVSRTETREVGQGSGTPLSSADESDGDSKMDLSDTGTTEGVINKRFGVLESVRAERAFDTKEQGDAKNGGTAVEDIPCDSKYCKARDEQEAGKSKEDKVEFGGHTTMNLFKVKVCKTKACQPPAAAAKFKAMQQTLAKQRQSGGKANHQGSAKQSLLEVEERQVGVGVVHAHQHAHYHFPSPDHVVDFLNLVRGSEEAAKPADAYVDVGEVAFKVMGAHNRTTTGMVNLTEALKDARIKGSRAPGAGEVCTCLTASLEIRPLTPACLLMRFVAGGLPASPPVAPPASGQRA